MTLYKIILFLLILILIAKSIATISKSDKKKKNQSKQDSFDIYDNVNIKINDIIEKGINYSQRIEDLKIFHGNTLGYVTPWNNYGYQIAKIFANKFSFISPVWLSFTYDGNDFQITGTRDIDIKWMMDLKRKNSKIKIIPRLLFENWSPVNFINVVRSEYIISKCIETITSFLLKYNFDGIVMEMWLQIGAYSKSDSYHFLRHFGDDMKNKNLVFILAIPPPIDSGNKGGYFNYNDFMALFKDVNFFSLMTYDYSNPHNPGPNSPFQWIENCVNILEPKNNFARSKILMGLNFYGYQYSYNEHKAIIRHELIDIFQKALDKEVIWHKDVKEHEFRIRKFDGSFFTIWYPTVESVNIRLNLAEKLGVGISIWEIGQGLDYFYNVL